MRKRQSPGSASLSAPFGKRYNNPPRKGDEYNGITLSKNTDYLFEYFPGIARSIPLVRMPSALAKGATGDSRFELYQKNPLKSLPNDSKLNKKPGLLNKKTALQNIYLPPKFKKP